MTAEDERYRIAAGPADRFWSCDLTVDAPSSNIFLKKKDSSSEASNYTFQAGSFARKLSLTASVVASEMLIRLFFPSAPLKK